MPKKPASFREPGFDSDNIIQYSHTPFVMEFKDGTKAKCSEFGKVTLTRDIRGTDEFDEITVSASVIYKLAFMLDETRDTKSIKREDLKKD